MIADWTMSLLLTALMATRQRSVSSQKRKRSIVGKRQCQKKENKPSSHLNSPDRKTRLPPRPGCGVSRECPAGKRDSPHPTRPTSLFPAKTIDNLFELGWYGNKRNCGWRNHHTVAGSDMFQYHHKNFPGHFTFAIFAFALHSCPHRTSSHNQSLTARDLKRIFFYK